MVIDVDSHFFEPLDWLEETAPSLAAELPPTDPVTLVIGTAFGEVLSTLPPEVKPDVADLIPKNFRLSEGPLTEAEIEKLTPLLRAWLDSIPGAHDANDRVAYLDAQGIDEQWILPTFAFNPISYVRRTMPERTNEIIGTYNRWASDQLAGGYDRLRPVPLIDPKNMSRAQVTAEMEWAREAGARAFAFWANPVDGKSLSHPDFHWFWEAAADNGLIAMLHVGAGRQVIDFGWLNNGRKYPSSHISYLNQIHQLPEMLLTELLSAGIFERLPGLRVLVCELGIDWLPAWRARADRIAKAARNYPWKELPSHYIDTNVRITPLHTDPTADVIDAIGVSSIVFSSDYPHNEGGKDAYRTFREQLSELDEESLDAFFGTTIEADLKLAN